MFNLAWLHYSTPLRQVAEQRSRLQAANKTAAEAVTSASRQRRLAVWAGSALAVLVAAGVGYSVLLRAPAATRVLTELQSTADEQVALANYSEIMDGGAAPTRWLWRMVYGGQATTAFSEFWNRRAATLDERALTRLKEGRIEEACMLGAAAAVKRDGPLNPEIQQAFDRERFTALQWTELAARAVCRRHCPPQPRRHPMAAVSPSASSTARSTGARISRDGCSSLQADGSSAPAIHGRTTPSAFSRQIPGGASGSREMVRRWS